MDKKIEKKKWTTKKLLIYSTAAVFIIVVFYGLVFGDQSSKLNVEKDRITISTVQKGPFQEFTPIVGTVQPIETFFLDVTEGGRVVKKYVEEGAFLNVGDPIIKLDNAQLTLDIIYNEANVFQQINSLRSTRLSFEQSKLNLRGQLLDLHYRILEQQRQYEQNKRLYEKNLISKYEFENSRDQNEYLKKTMELTRESFTQDSLFRLQQIEQLEKSVETLQNNLQITKQQLENLTVTAPIKGQLTSLNVEIGESISRGENLGQIDDVAAFKIRAEIDEHWIARVSKGYQGTFTFAGKDYRLEIATVYPQVTNGRFTVDMHFMGEQPDGIRRGQTVHIKLELSEQSEAVFVDRGGFYQTTGGQWIFVVDQSGDFAERRNIKLGKQNTQSYEVLSGLKPGEMVVTSSYDNYNDIEKLIIN